MIVKSLPIKEFLLQSNNHVLIDVRAPIEFNKGHLAHAINIPLFEDSERTEIGTLYKQQGKDIAVNRGLEIVSPKMVEFVNSVKKITHTKTVFVYCFRGGMRSNSFAWLMNTSGLNAQILEGGYKAYRNYVLNYFNIPKKLILLGGNTGSGKTEVLKKLALLNYQTVDLEKLAHHKGSAFGSINEEKQNPQQVFENNLMHTFLQFNQELPFILEDESQSIGYNKIPHELWLQMKKATIIKLNIPFEARVKKLVKDYSTTDTEALKSCVIKISQQLGTLNTKLCLDYLDEGNLIDVARLSLHYYDKAYNYTYGKKTEQNIIHIESDTIDEEVNAQKVVSVLNSL
jgi:tRNA 2-selenouridine synthase